MKILTASSPLSIISSFILGLTGHTNLAYIFLAVGTAAIFGYLFIDTFYSIFTMDEVTEEISIREAQYKSDTHNMDITNYRHVG